MVNMYFHGYYNTSHLRFSYSNKFKMFNECSCISVFKNLYFMITATIL